MDLSVLYTLMNWKDFRLYCHTAEGFIGETTSKYVKTFLIDQNHLRSLLCEVQKKKGILHIFFLYVEKIRWPWLNSETVCVTFLVTFKFQLSVSTGDVHSDLNTGGSFYSSPKDCWLILPSSLLVSSWLVSCTKITSAKINTTYDPLPWVL